MAGIRLEFAQFGDFDSFDIFRSNSPMDISALPAPLVTGLSTMYYEDTAIVAEENYYYRVRVNRDGFSKISSEIRVAARISDPYWNNVVLLLPLDDSATDLSEIDHAPILGSTVSYADGKFGKASKHLGRASDAIKYGASDFGFDSTEDFTIEFYALLTSKPTGAFYSAIGSWFGNVGWCVFFTPTGIFTLFGTTGIGADINYSVNTWYYVTVERSGGVCTFYIDGVSMASATLSSATASYDLVVGGNNTSGDWFNGLIDDVRITKGYARYKGNHAPPIEPHIIG